MNFLAHFHLAWPDEGLVAGALEGDYYKGPIGAKLPRDLEQGIRLHRAIDAYTDAHPRLQSLRADLPPELRRFAGILLDLSFDHFLARHWRRFSDVPQSEFNAAVYRTLRLRESQLSSGSRHMLARLVEHDILALYREWDTVTASAERIGVRFRRGNPFVDIHPRLTPLRETLEQGFLDFYPDLVAFSAQQRESLRNQERKTPS